MKTRVSLPCVLTVASLCILFAAAGCETYGQAGGLGAVLGAGTGAIIGNQSGHSGEGALIGGVVGGLAGLVAHDVKARKQKAAAATAAQYNYQPTQGEMLTLESCQVLPSAIQRGNLVEASIQYAILGTGGGTQVTEARSLRRGDQVISEVSSKTFTRDDGTWVSTQQFKVPENLEPGTYTVVQVVQTAQSRISGTSQFQAQ